ncbi:PIN domain-containing protein [Actinoplanes sp. NPDC049596]|uniref:PIN domain-containing protein n=1 Tax=unclassified Actinoplanes TaxID=2626549 RepID=UPI00341E04F7
MKYLADASALIRILRKQADPAWDEVLSRGLISICEPALAETLRAADAKRYAEAEATVAWRCLPVIEPDGIWDQVAVIRRGLARRATHTGPSVVDMLIAATALRLKLTVLHEDRDFATIGDVVPELRQRSIRSGPKGNDGDR